MRRIGLLLIVIVALFAFAQPAEAVPPLRITFNFTADPLILNDICSFPVVVDSVVRGTEIDYFDATGAPTMILVHQVEQDTFTANGKSLTGTPYTAEIQVLFDAQGNVTHIFASGLVERLTFPNGTLFISAGRLDFVAHPESMFLLSPDVGVTGDVDAFCNFLS